MMLVSHIGQLFLWFIAAPVLLGMLYTKFSGADRDSFMLAYCSGMIIQLAICQLLSVPAVLNGGTQQDITGRYVWIVVLLCVLSIVLNFTFFVKFIVGLGEKLYHCPWTIWIAVILILLQTVNLAARRHIDEDDAYYVGIAVIAEQEGALYTEDPYTGDEVPELNPRYILSPFPLYIANAALVTGIPSAVIAHTVFPMVFIPFSYMIYGLLGSWLLKKNRWLLGCFMILVSVVLLFSGYSIYTEGMFLLTRVWQGKAILAAGLLPAVWYYGMRASDKKRGIWIEYLMLLMLMIACCHVSSMGIMLGAITAGVMGISCSIRYRKWEVLPLTFICCIPNLIYAGIYMSIR